MWEKLLHGPVPGFRPGRTPFSLIVSRLITQLKNEQELTNPNSYVWNLFGNAWKFWVESHTEINEILLKFDNGADFDENDECITLPNSELDIKCFEFLLEASCNTSIHQEMIRSFYEYGYFNEDERIENLINQLPSFKEIEQRQRLEGLPNEIDDLSRTVNKLSQTVESLNSLFSTKKSTDKLEQRLVQQIAEISQSFGQQLQKLERKIERMNQSFDTRLSKVKTQGVGQTVKQPGMLKVLNRINQFETRLSTFENSVKSLESKPTVTKFTNNIEQKIAQLIDQRMQDGIKKIDSQTVNKIKPFEARLDAAENVIAEIKSKTVYRPKIADDALEIGERHGDHLQNQDARYSDEEDYLSIFTHGLRRFGVTDSEEEARAIHVAMKAFPALEVTDGQIMRVWNMVCGNHLHFTTIEVEIGWFGLQDWFPDLFAQECFKERLEQIDLEISIRKMLELGNMPWVIYLRNCDRSFPETYLPRFLDWISGLCGNIKVFLVRSSGINRCETSEDFYDRIARLPNTQKQEPIEPQNLKPMDLVTLTEWTSWCSPDSKIDSQYETHFDFIEEIRSTVGSRDWKIPIELLREIKHYLRLSHNIMTPTRALDWALTLRLLPWIGNRHRLIDIVQNFVNESNQELPYFQEGLQVAREADE